MSNLYRSKYHLIFHEKVESTIYSSQTIYHILFYDREELFIAFSCKESPWARRSCFKCFPFGYHGEIFCFVWDVREGEVEHNYSFAKESTISSIFCSKFSPTRICFIGNQTSLYSSLTKLSRFFLSKLLWDQPSISIAILGVPCSLHIKKSTWRDLILERSHQVSFLDKPDFTRIKSSILVLENIIKFFGTFSSKSW